MSFHGQVTCPGCVFNSYPVRAENNDINHFLQRTISGLTKSLLCRVEPKDGVVSVHV